MARSFPRLTIGHAIGLGLILGGFGCDTSPDPTTVPAESTATVEVIMPGASGIARTTTQPAIVYPWYEARIFANVSGYVDAVKADIGTPVGPNAELATLSVPELVLAHKALEAEVRRLEADEERVTAGVTVAEKTVASAVARRDQAKARVAEAEATLTAARAESDRVRDLVGQRAVSNRVGDEATKRLEAADAIMLGSAAGVTSAEAEVELAEARLTAAKADREVSTQATEVARRRAEEAAALAEYGVLRAPPFAGIVTQRHVDPGDLVRKSDGNSKGGRPLFVVTSTGKVRVRVVVPERDAPHLTADDPVTLTFPALPGKSFMGLTVSRTAGVLDGQTRTVLAEVDVPNESGELMSGMFGQATIILHPGEAGVRVPANVVRYAPNGKASVYVLSPGDIVETRAVTTGTDTGTEIVITSGLSVTDRVIKPSARPVRPGDRVTVR